MVELQLILVFTYTGAKAGNITDAKWNESFVLRTLRSDLTFLGIPHPKAVNIRVPSPGRILFFWDTWSRNVCLAIPRSSSLY